MSQSASIVVETSSPTFDSVPLPDGWQWVRLGDVCNTTSGGTPSRGVKAYYGGSIAWVKSGELKDGEIYSTEETITKEGLANSSAKLFPAGTLLIALYGATVGKLGILEIDAATNQAVCAIFPSDSVHRDYLFYYLLKERESLLKISFGGAQPNISQDIVRSIKIALPPLPEQKRIAAILKEQLAAVERARAATEAQLKAAKDLPAAFLCAVFDGSASQEWQFVKVGDISSLIIDGPHITPMYVPKGVPFVTVRNIVNRRVDLSQLSYITEADHAEFTRRGKAERGDILYTKDGTLGIPCVVDTDEEFSFFVSVALIKLIRERADSRFVAYALESPLVLKQVELLGAGAGLKHMVLRSIRALEIPLPPMPEQRKIAGTLNEQMLKAEQAKKILKDQLDSINKLPAALLRQAFTGKL